MGFNIREKFSPRYNRPFDVLERSEPVTCRLALSPRLVGAHDVFHASALRRYLFGPSHIIDFTPLEISENLRYEERPLRVLDQEMR